MDTDFNLWKECLNGAEDALQYMLHYNKKDVAILEEIYLKLRPWIKNHPNMGNLQGDNVVCSICGSDNIHVIPNKYYFTQVGKYNVYRCKDCGAISRGRKNINTKTELNSVGK